MNRQAHWLIEVQAFMNRNKITVCYEYNGKLFKHLDNVKDKGHIIEHQLSAGVRKNKKVKNG